MVRRSVVLGCLVGGVAGRLQLECGVFHVEVPGEALLEAVEYLRSATVQEALVADDDVR